MFFFFFFNYDDGSTNLTCTKAIVWIGCLSTPPSLWLFSSESLTLFSALWCSPQDSILSPGRIAFALFLCIRWLPFTDAQTKDICVLPKLPYLLPSIVFAHFTHPPPSCCPAYLILPHIFSPLYVN